MILTLPYPPSTNGLYAAVRGRLILSARGRAYHADVLAAVAEAGLPKAPAGRLRVEVDLSPPDRRRRDIMNCEKCLTDSLVAAAVLKDDCLIDRFEITRMPPTPGGSCVVRISKWEPPEGQT